MFALSSVQLFCANFRVFLLLAVDPGVYFDALFRLLGCTGLMKVNFHIPFVIILRGCGRILWLYQLWFSAVVRIQQFEAIATCSLRGGCMIWYYYFYYYY
ncbi:hypothetical protein Dimus_011252 [Dionaea muscipula]